MDVLVLGAGVVGITTAYCLARRGHSVRVVEGAPSAARGTSFANGGQLSYCYTDPLASPAILPKLPGLALGRDPAFELHPSLDPALIRWVTQFLRNCTGERELRNLRNVLRLALHSRKVLHGILAEHEIAFDFRKCGKLHVYEDEDALKKVNERVRLKNDCGCGQEVLDADACLEREPALATIAAKIAGGVYSPLDEAGDAHLFAECVERICREQYGTEFLYRTRITGITGAENGVANIKTDNGLLKAEAYVVALGPNSSSICDFIDLDVPVYPLKGYSITVPAKSGAPSISITDTANKMVYCRLGERLRIAGMVELAGFDVDIDADKISLLIDKARERFPDAGDYDNVIHRWSGLRPATPGSAPLLGETPIPNLFLNTGHGMLGWTLSCGSADLVAQILDGDSPAIDLDGLTFASR